MAKSKPIKVIKVKSYKDLPHDPNDDKKGVRAESYPKERVIFFVGSPSEESVAHEKYHIIKRHPMQPRSPQDYANQELEAMYYAYQKTGYPKRVVQQLRAITNDVWWRRYKNSKAKTESILNNALNHIDAPLTWKRDWDNLRQQLRDSIGLKRGRKPKSK